MTGLRELADAAGIDAGYRSWRGDIVTASDDALVAAIRAVAPDLGVSFESAGDAPAALAALERLRWAEIVPSATVGWAGELVVPFSVPAALDGPWVVEIATESGRTVRAEGQLFDLPAEGHAWPGGVVHCVRRARIAVGELGYHTARWQAAGTRGEAFAIIAPERAWGGPGSGPRRWGVFAPLYGLASPASGQTGDLATMRRLFALLAARGGRYVATLPILAASLDEPCEFSPYAPTSRMFWNELYLDLGAVAAELGAPSPAAPPIVAGAPIDYRSQYRWRRHALDPMAERLMLAHGAEIDAWAAETGAYDYAAFRAIGEVARKSWHSFPSPWRDGAPVVKSRADAIALGADAARVTTHAVAQWAMQRQLEQLAGGPVQLYLDLPVGVSCDAYDVWRYRPLFLTSLSAGAPPDELFLGGQDWGLPPLSPTALRRDRYRYLIRCLRHHMQIAGMLRIDHVMGLFRLYSVPYGFPATQGVYLRYPHEELLAIVALESNRARCAVAGEDLGTVPEQVRPAMTRHGLFRLHVGQWAFPAKPGEPIAPSPAESIATLNTHDMSTFAGWWRGADIDDRRDLGMITDEQEAEERLQRDHQRTALLAFVDRQASRASASPEGAVAAPALAAGSSAVFATARGALAAPATAFASSASASASSAAGPASSAASSAPSAASASSAAGAASASGAVVPTSPSPGAVARVADDGLTDVERAMVGASADLAAGAAEVVLLALDDLVLDPTPQNVPGTTTQRANWQRRVEGWSETLDPQRAPPAAAAAIAAIRALRPSD